MSIGNEVEQVGAAAPQALCQVLERKGENLGFLDTQACISLDRNTLSWWLRINGVRTQ